MKSVKMVFVRSIAAVLFMAACLAFTNATLAQPQDKRKQTTIQTATADVGDKAKAVEIRYLDLPWGPVTFGYLENGGSDYYSTRTWPFAHLKLAAPAKFNGKKLTPGDYIMIISPKGVAPKMTLSIASYKPATENGTFLVPGNVFVDTPQGDVITKKPAVFAKGAPMADVMKIDLESAKNDVTIKVHYGDRLMTEKLTLK